MGKGRRGVVQSGTQRPNNILCMRRAQGSAKHNTIFSWKLGVRRTGKDDRTVELFVFFVFFFNEKAHFRGMREGQRAPLHSDC